MLVPDASTITPKSFRVLDFEGVLTSKATEIVGSVPACGGGALSLELFEKGHGVIPDALYKTSARKPLFPFAGADASKGRGIGGGMKSATAFGQKSGFGAADTVADPDEPGEVGAVDAEPVDPGAIDDQTDDIGVKQSELPYAVGSSTKCIGGTHRGPHALDCLVEIWGKAGCSPTVVAFVC